MALKLKKYPKKPKASASVTTLENYIAKCKQVDKDNAQIKSSKTKRANLLKQVAKIGRAN